MENIMKVGKYELVYKPKIDRAIEAVRLAGKDVSDEKLIAVEYDKLGGLIRLDGENVDNGVFLKKDEEAPKKEVKEVAKKVAKKSKK